MNVLAPQCGEPWLEVRPVDPARAGGTPIVSLLGRVEAGVLTLG